MGPATKDLRRFHGILIRLWKVRLALREVDPKVTRGDEIPLN